MFDLTADDPMEATVAAVDEALSAQKAAEERQRDQAAHIMARHLGQEITPGLQDVAHRMATSPARLQDSAFEATHEPNGAARPAQTRGADGGLEAAAAGRHDFPTRATHIEGSASDCGRAGGRDRGPHRGDIPHQGDQEAVAEEEEKP